MNLLKSEIIRLLKETTTFSPEEIEASLEKPLEVSDLSIDKKRGDIALACFKLAKKLRKAPEELAHQIATSLKPQGLITSIIPEGGYINFFADTKELCRQIFAQIFKDKDKYGTSNKGKGKTIVLDYSSPNIAKPMGIGHLRSTVIGNALYKIYQALGYKCIRINYLGDWGTQFGMLIADYKENPYQITYNHQFNTAEVAKRYVAYNEKAKTDPSLLEKAKLEFKKLEEDDPENIALWQKFRELSIKEFERLYHLLGINFDEYAGESMVNKMVNSVIELLEKKGLVKTSAGALMVDLSRYGMPACLLKKSDGTTLYAARDIAEAIRRYEKYQFHKMIYVVGSDQKLHFQQVFKVLELMGYPWVQNCVHVDFGLVHFKGMKMSTRTGTTVLLEEVFSEAVSRSKAIMKERIPELKNKVALSQEDQIAQAVGIGAIIFNDLKNKRTRDIEFDWAQILSFDGETGPYLQYTHTRLASLLKKASELEVQTVNYELLSTPEEQALVKLIGDFPEVIDRASEEYEPSVISNYLLKLASLFNRFYRYHRIISDDLELTRARITLCMTLKYVIKHGLLLLGIEPLEAM